LLSIDTENLKLLFKWQLVKDFFLAAIAQVWSKGSDKLTGCLPVRSTHLRTYLASHVHKKHHLVNAWMMQILPEYPVVIPNLSIYSAICLSHADWRLLEITSTTPIGETTRQTKRFLLAVDN